jgi:hypothetical protein
LASGFVMDLVRICWSFRLQQTDIPPQVKLARNKTIFNQIVTILLLLFTKLDCYFSLVFNRKPDPDCGRRDNLPEWVWRGRARCGVVGVCSESEGRRRDSESESTPSRTPRAAASDSETRPFGLARPGLSAEGLAAAVSDRRPLNWLVGNRCIPGLGPEMPSLADSEDHRVLSLPGLGRPQFERRLGRACRLQFC